MQFGTVEQAIADIKAGKLIIVADDEDRENEGDLICAAQLVTPELINFMIRKAGGWICLALTGDRADQLQLPQQSKENTEEQRTAFTVSIDAAGKIFLQDQEVQLPELVSKLQAIAQNNQDRRIFVRGDKDLAYGRIMEVMGTITQGGFTKVALLAEQPTLPAKPAPASQKAG